MLQNNDVTAHPNAPTLPTTAAVVTGAATPPRFSVTMDTMYTIYAFVAGIAVGLFPSSVIWYLLNPSPYWLWTGALSATAVGIWGIIVAIAGGHLTITNQRIQQRIDQWKQRKQTPPAIKR
jgi:hypothetical protein